MATESIHVRKRGEKARQGVFFISLSLSATLTVLAMLVVLLGYMLYRGSHRLFFSPVYDLTFTDGTRHRTELNENLEFEVIDEDGRPAVRVALQAAKYYLNQKTEVLKFSRAPVPKDVKVEVWKDMVVEEDDPWGSPGDAAQKIKATKTVKTEDLTNAVEARYDNDKKVYTLIFEDGTERVFEGAVKIHFRRGAHLLDMKTLVTYYLQDHPDEGRRRQKEIDGTLKKLHAQGYPVDTRWKAFLVAFKEEPTPSGGTYLREQRIREFPPVASFAIHENWNWFQFFWQFPRSSNTEGGVLPCIFGTVLMTLIMILVVTPFGIATAVYLMEYARETFFTRMVRLAVANLAGVPSIIFGLFGLGFFILTVGGGIDHAFYGGDKVFGTPCILWASLTMALLTLPVMIVASEEALRTVPRELREGAMALGATKLSTILTVVLPSAMPGILTGVILAVARGAGEVAPLLLTGVVAHKDQLPFNPLEKFMDLAYHIYDLSVKSPPNKIEEAQSLAFSSALVLVMVIVTMNVFAILLRARLARIKLS